MNKLEASILSFLKLHFQLSESKYYCGYLFSFKRQSTNILSTLFVFFYVALIKIIEFFILDYLPNTTYKTYAEITCFVELLVLK